MRDAEHRLYLVLRSDIVLSRADLAKISGQASWAALRCAAQTAHGRMRAYDGRSQPKIALRVKSGHHLRRAHDEALQAGLPAVLVELSAGVPMALGIGPARRPELPGFIAKLQILPDLIPAAAAPSAADHADRRHDDDLSLWLFFRHDLEIPYGKLAGQAGHGVWGAVQQAYALRPESVPRWLDGDSSIEPRALASLAELEAGLAQAILAGLPASLIIDEGRTVFARPTATVLGVGPCRASELPPLLAGAAAL